ncbi:unnamed protein product [Didymodactylos carnosus]|uniref:Uncharacterized protein n=1 Tax=Didymodactylos carnosus TaxID=1234261 RepID=A0A8S2GDH5_9BILA|nr:unnamed protein product [Didymodactylos carnosus]CAF3495797.1 unnamed protein product [Didymodactylos carnosus]
MLQKMDNGRELVTKVIEEPAGMWKDLKIVHGRARHPQLQRSIERCNQHIKQLIVLSGHEPKIGLTSTSLHPSIFDSITTEEELEKELDIPAVVDQDTIDEGESSHETEGKGSKNDDEESSGEQDGQDLDMSSLND